MPRRWHEGIYRKKPEKNRETFANRQIYPLLKGSFTLY